jgi:membrane protease YdiL (CAAX protease family)
VIGVFMVNTPNPQGALDPHLWSLLSFTGMILVFNDWQMPAPRTRAVRAIGAVILLLAAIVYQGSGEERVFVEMTTQWWGILGLIGWAYLVGCLVYTLGHREPAALMGAMALLIVSASSPRKACSTTRGSMVGSTTARV